MDNTVHWLEDARTNNQRLFYLFILQIGSTLILYTISTYSTNDITIFTIHIYIKIFRFVHGRFQNILISFEIHIQIFNI